MTIRDLQRKYSSASAETHPYTVFLSDIRAAASDPSILTSDLRILLDRRVGEFLPEGERICAGGSPTPDDRQALTEGGLTVAALMLVLMKMNSAEALREAALLFLQYSATAVKSGYDFTEAALDAASRPIASLGFRWKDLENASALDIIAYKFIRDTRYRGTGFAPLIYSGRGSVQIRDGRMEVSSFCGTESGAEAFRCLDDRITVLSRSVRDERLKSSERDEADALAEFGRTYLETLGRSRGSRDARREPADGDIVDIEYCWDARRGCYFRMLDDDYPLTGQLEEEDLVAGLSAAELEEHIYEEDCIRGAVLRRGPDSVSFSIRDAYRSWAKRTADAANRSNACFDARVTHVREDIRRLNWVSAYGFNCVSLIPEGRAWKVGDTALMEMMNVQSNGSSMYINIQPAEYSLDGTPVRLPDDEDLLRGFVTSRREILEQREQERQRQAVSDTRPVQLGRIASVMVRQALRLPSLEKYRTLLCCLFLLRITGGEERLRALLPEAFWLRCCISFAQGKSVNADAGEALDERRLGILRSLAALRDGNVTAAIPANGGDDTAERIAALCAAWKLCAPFPDEFHPDGNAFRLKICNLLGCADAFRPTQMHTGGKYGSVERQTVEFKSSYVMRNDGQGPDLDYQGRGQVFEAVCAFLNADGGELYLGVNDAGEPIRSEDMGLRGDMAWLCANYDTVRGRRYQQLGHGIPKADTIDHYVLFLNAEKELYLSDSVQSLVTIEATEDADAIRFTVRPSRHEIAYLYSDKSRTDGVAYMRDGGRTIPMTALHKQQRLLSLTPLAREKAFAVTIREAIEAHRKLIFKGYSSGNSGQVKDRHIVPVNLFYNDENVYCWDLEARDYRQFRLYRISEIETDGDEPYQLPADAARRNADVFRWLGDRTYHIRVRMDVAARNYLLEEYSAAKDLPKEEFYEESKDKWILDTHLQGLGAIRRFYLGLADKMEILDTEDAPLLRREITAFVNRNFPRQQ